jgi:hypothetical protein
LALCTQRLSADWLARWGHPLVAVESFVDAQLFRGTALRRSLLAVGRTAAERTAQVVPMGIARVGQEENAALPAPGQAGAQMRLGVQHRSQQHVILQYQGGSRAPAVPVHPELKMLRDPDCKRPKLSPKMLMLKDTPSSYRIGTPVSRT